MKDLILHYCKNLPFAVQVKAYEDPYEALRDPRIDAFSIDLMILDILLPGMNAYEFLENVQKRVGEENLPNIIAMTAIANHQLVIKLQQDFKSEFLQKPFKKQAFLDLVCRKIFNKKAA